MNLRATSRPTLVVATTGEPMQPVRLFYVLTPGSRDRVRRRLESIRCVRRHPRAAVWGWWHRKEASKLDFSGYAASARPSRDPVILGMISFPRELEMEIRVRSYHRAWLAATFFAPRLGPEVVLSRVRMLNRMVTADDAMPGLEAIDALLDRDVVVKIPPTVSRLEARLAARSPAAGPVSPEEIERICAEELERCRADDLPEVEDFPLYPEEETATFSSLKLTLDIRLLRAMSHWQGRTDVSLVDIIRETVERTVAQAGAPTAPAPD